MDVQNLTTFQMIFLRSKANGAIYNGDDLPVNAWRWPKNSWLKQKVKELRKEKDK